MKTVELIPGIKSSVAGFACASVMGARGSSDSRRAIDFALDHGINHFDLARSYGYGEAEAFIGRHYAQRRKDMVIATKFGIVATWKAGMLKPVKPLVWMMKKGRDNAAAAPQQQAQAEEDSTELGTFYKRIPINAANMRFCLEQSLRALRTAHVEYFMIHEPLETVHDIEEVFMLGDKLKQEGKIRALGIASMRKHLALHKDYISRFDFAQFNLSAGTVDYSNTLSERSNKSNILFSAYVDHDTNQSAAEKLRVLHRDFPQSVLVCSMFSEDRIKHNIKALEQAD